MAAWYKEWFGEEYLELYAHRDSGEAERHIDFVEPILGSAESPPRSILDLACGAGRHTEVLRRRGYQALGADLSVTLLARRPDLPRVAADMGRLPFAAGAFDWVLNFFTSFGYFEREEENFRVLEEIARVLEPGGRLLIDLLNPGPAIARLEPRESNRIDGRRIEIERWFDPSSHRINKRIRISSDDRGTSSYLESVRVYSREEVTARLGEAGLGVIAVYGSFAGETYTEESERIILLAERARA